MRNHLDRRSFIVGGLALSTLAACGGGGPKAARLGVRFPDGFRAPSVAVVGSGPQRFPFVVVADDGLPMIAGAPESIVIEVLRDGDVVTTQTIPVHGAGQFTPYYPLEFTPPEAGSYLARTDFSDTDLEFAVVDRDRTTLFQVGETLPGFDTPTFDDPRGVNPICTRSEQCAFHEITLTEALANDKPTALLIATPAFCQTDVCGPSLEFLIEAVGARTDINVIHAEVYKDFAGDVGTPFPETAPLIDEWEFEFEPSLWITDAGGTIVAAKHFAFDREETASAIALI